MTTEFRKPRVIVAVCTFNRNDELAHLLGALSGLGKSHSAEFSLGVVVVDDSAEGIARNIVEGFDGDFDMGSHYFHSGARNISTARNMAMTAAMDLGEWVAMTDDDCEPDAAWLSELLRVQRATDADVVTGGLIRRAPDDAPKWIREQPFLSASRFDADDGQRLNTAFTNNCLISSAILKGDAGLRFKPEFGRIGGEDTVFFHAVMAAGHRMHFAKHAIMYENETAERLTFAYQLRRFFWYGNTSVQTMMEKGAGRPRLALHGLANLGRSAVRPVGSVLRGKQPQLRHALAEVCRGMGQVAGVLGFRMNHK